MYGFNHKASRWYGALGYQGKPFERCGKNTGRARLDSAVLRCAARAHNIKVGLYFSHLDWSHPDYASIRPKSDDWWSNSPFNTPPKGQPDDIKRWNPYLQFHKAQLTELLTNFGTVDLLWFDGVWERTPELWHFKEMNDYIRSLNPEIIINSRIGGYGDYKTHEQAMLVSAPDGIWEFCVTLNDSWGYQPQDHNYKSLHQLIRIFTECIGMGGNLLLDIGPKADGSIDERAQELLLGLGEWIHRNSEAVYQTDRGLPPGLFFGNSTISNDRKKLFLFYYDLPSGPIALKGVQNKIKRISVWGHDASLTFAVNGGFERMPGIMWIDVPQTLCDPHCTVLQVEPEGELDLYKGQGGGIQ